MKATTSAVVRALIKSPLNSLKELTRDERSDERNYLFCMAHPDDEILIAGFGNRASRKGRAYFMTVTNGDANTDDNRLPELEKSYRLMEYVRDVDNLLSEREIYDLAKSSPGTTASPRNVSRLAELVLWASEEVAKRAEAFGSRDIVTNSFEGGHPVHDLTNMAAFLAARDLGVALYETPQYSLVPKPGTQVEEIRQVINHNRSAGKNGVVVPLGIWASYNMGIPLGGDSKGLDDPSLGVVNGSFDVSIGDIRRKLKMKKAHASQGESLGGSSNNITHADFSRERILGVPRVRDFTTLPAGAYPLYELCDWRRNPISFETIRAVARELELDGRD